MSDDHQTFYVGDADLVLLGLAAALAARYESRRKGGMVRNIEGYPQGDQHAVELVRRGIELAASVAPDDVPELEIGISAPAGVVIGLIRRFHLRPDLMGENMDPEDIEEWLDGDEWKGGDDA
jgi:hypothetical protein